jgi:alkanesulfonate monooxygenase SsuD/methylene tetrahydromethanopterin reductase-like flavin-dependent oxidoreductase (luciferase family)
MTDDQLTVDWALDNIMIAGSPKTVADKLTRLRDTIGPFGTIVAAGLDWDDKALWQRSMELMARDVVPML